MGVTVSVCGATTTFDTYLYLLDNACNIDTFNDDGCSVQSVFSKALCNTGRYYIVVDGKQATSMGTFTLTVTENPNFSFSVSATKTDVSCAGGSDGTATATVSGGNAPYTYLWNDPSSQTTQTATGLLPGTYTVTVTDQDGCTTTASVTINEPAPLSVTTTATNVTCGGANDGTATANVSGGTPPYAYVWNTTPIQTLPTAIQLAVGTYFVTVTDANGCTASASATVNTTTSVVINTVNESDISCFGANDGSIDIDVTGGDPPYAYAWSHGPATQDVSGLAPGFYEVTVSDSLGCIAVQSYFITEPPLLNVQVQNVVDVLCNGNNTGGVDISVVGGTPPYTYAWSSGYTTEDLLSVPAGIYQVIVTDANGCQDTAQTVVDEPQPLVSSVTVHHPACADQMDGSADLTVSGGTPPYTYFWSNFQTTQDLANAPAGMYTVVITDANGCVRVDTATLLAPPEITVSVDITRPACNGADDGVIDLTVNGGTPPYQFQWSDGATTEDISSVAAGSYDVTVTDDDGCTVSESISVDEPEVLQLQLTAVDVSCIGDSNGVVVASVTGGKSPYQYQWSGGLGNTAIIESLPPGDYALTVTDANGCSATGMAAVEEPAVDPEDCIAEEKYGVVVPNAFTPNGDGLNDRFEVVHIGARKIEMRIFNRWGEEIYYNPDVSTPGNGWDGKYEGKDVPVGSYAYLLNVEFWNGQNRKLVGSVTVVR
ncbi:MAG: hypothetical protein D6706_22260 [Chloroflexi bacterium]|nr:MAG: hypothetical protein D6706_22260 [Chloroflexota bacterium]